MNKTVIRAAHAIVFILVLSIPGFAQADQCKSAVDAWTNAKDAETKACNEVSKSSKDEKCEEYRKRTEEAAKKMRNAC